MRKIITFLGTSPYEDTIYEYNGVSYSTPFCAEAIAKIIKPDKILVCATKAVHESANYTKLRERLQQLEPGIEVASIDIPEGRAKTELWEIFQKINDNIQSGDSVYFDITNSFRSLPFITFLVIAFLRQAGSVVVEKVLYGAYVKGQKNTPILDLTEFVQLLDWMNAASWFKKQGDGDHFAMLLKESRVFGQGAKNDNNLIGQAAKGVESVSEAIRLNQPFMLGEASYELQQKLDRASTSIEKLAPPFAVVLQQVRTEYERFATDEANDSPIDTLEKQLLMIEWYFGKKRFLQAITLMREWLVSWRILKDKRTATIGDVRDRTKRENTERALFGDDLWKSIGETRNPIAHCGMSKSNVRKDPLSSPEDIEKAMQQFLDEMHQRMDTVKGLANWK